MEGKQFELVEENAIDSPVQDIKWHGQEIEFSSDLVQDKGKGKPIILRKFDFAKNPSVQLYDKDEIADTYRKYIDMFLWKDSLKRIADLKVIIDKDKFTIFATCQAKTGAVVLDKPLKL